MQAIDAVKVMVNLSKEFGPVIYDKLLQVLLRDPFFNNGYYQDLSKRATHITVTDTTIHLEDRSSGKYVSLVEPSWQSNNAVCSHDSIMPQIRQVLDSFGELQTVSGFYNGTTEITIERCNQITDEATLYFRIYVQP